jgi:hypothetical protein
VVWIETKRKQAERKIEKKRITHPVATNSNYHHGAIESTIGDLSAKLLLLSQRLGDKTGHWPFNASATSSLAGFDHRFSMAISMAISMAVAAWQM